MTVWNKRGYKQNEEDLESATSPYVADNGKVIKQFPVLDPVGVSRGQYDGVSFVAKFGRNATVGNSAEEVLWDQQIAVYTYMTTASTLYISSDDNADTQTYDVQGLDENWNMQTVSVTLSGYTSVPLSGSWIRVFRAYNTSGTNSAGEVYVADSSASTNGTPDVATTIKARVIAGNNQTNMAIYTVPAGHKGYLMDWYISLLRGSGTAVIAGDFDIYRRPVGTVFRSTQPVGLQNTGAGDHHYTWPYPIELEPKTDIEIRCFPTATADASGGFTVLLIN